MTVEEILKKVKLIELRVKKRINTPFLGEYKSTFKGIGTTFSEIRNYQYGDDVKKIDWNTTAKYNKPYVKIFEEEREMISMILIDISASMNFGTKVRVKDELVAEIAAVLSVSAIKNNDKVGLILFSDKIDVFLPPEKGNWQTRKIIKSILEVEPKQSAVNIKIVFDFLLKSIKRKISVFLISDFNFRDLDIALPIVRKRHDIIGIRVYDELENNMPDVGINQFIDAETNERRWVNTTSSNIRAEYRKYYYELLSSIQSTFRQNGNDLLNISTKDDYIKVLFNFFISHKQH